MQLHPYIINLIAQDQIAQMHARAETDRQIKAAARERKAARRHAARARLSGHRMPAHQGWPTREHVARPVIRDDNQLVSVGRTGSDDCL